MDNHDDSDALKMAFPDGMMIKFDTSIAVTICPECYGKRDLKVPLLFIPTNRRFVLPDGEVVGRENFSTAVCPSCGHYEA